MERARTRADCRINAYRRRRRLLLDGQPARARARVPTLDYEDRRGGGGGHRRALQAVRLSSRSDNSHASAFAIFGRGEDARRLECHDRE